MGKRAYERLATTRGGERLKAPSKVTWAEGDDLFLRVQQALLEGAAVTGFLRREALPYKVFKQIGERVLGVDGYRVWAERKKSLTGQQNIRLAHAKYERMTPEEKAAYFQRYRGTCRLERELAGQLIGWDVKLNQWQALLVAGRVVPREADIKVALPRGHKLVVLCDGVAFHGPKSIFDPDRRVADDVATADAYFEAGYSVIRYSEVEIQQGWAQVHALAALARLSTSGRVYRTWYPLVERWEE